jgi:sulfur-carrier protein
MPTVSFTRALERFLPAPSTVVEGATVGAALAAVFASRPVLRGYVLDDQGALRGTSRFMSTAGWSTTASG